MQIAGPARPPWNVLTVSRAASALALLAGVVMDAEAAAVPGQDAVRRALDAFVEAGAVPGYAAVLVGPSAEATLTAGNVSATEISGVASVTKVFTALALADLVREGKAGLDDPVRVHVPGAERLPKWGSREILLRDLATHTSGLPEGHMGESLGGARKWLLPRTWKIAFKRFVLRRGEGMLAGVTWDDLFAFLADAKLQWEPGSRWQYSNVGMGLLGHVVEEKAGKSYEEVLLSLVCRPLGMSNTLITLPRGAPKPRVHIPLGPLAGAGGLHSNAADLALFVKAALGRGTPPALREDFEITFKPAGRIPDGRVLHLGWQEDGKTGRLYHAGQNHAFIGIDRGRGTAVVLVLGAGQQGIEGLGLAMLDAVSGGRPEFPRPRVAVVLPPERLAGYAGVWRLDGESAVELAVLGRALRAQFVKGGRKGGVAVLWPEDERRFFCRDWDCQAEFIPARGSEPASVKFAMYSWEGTYRREGR